MEKKYYAVTRKGVDDLQHWKYIKKKKVNGKWKYYYDQGEVDKYKNKKTTQYRKKDGTRVKIEWEDNPDSFISSQRRFELHSSSPYSSNGYKSKTITNRRGKMEKFVDAHIAKGEKYVYDRFLKNKN